MAIREFDGIDDYIGFDGLGTAYASSPRSIVGVIKPLVLGSGEPYVFVGRTTGTDDILQMIDGLTSGRLGYADLVDGGTSADTGMTASDWQILGIDKGSGTVLGRGHRSIVGSGSWTHNNMAAARSDFADLWTFTWIGRNESAWKNCRIAVIAIFGYQLSDANYVTIGGASSTQAIYDLGPLALWEFNQGTTADPVVDLAGSLDQVTSVGTTVISGDDPTWTFGLYGPGGTPNLRVIRSSMRW
jgi:hypothetical protein